MYNKFLKFLSFIRNYSGGSGSRISRSSGYENYNLNPKYGGGDEYSLYTSDDYLQQQYKPKYSDYYPGRNDYNKNYNNLDEGRYECDNEDFTSHDKGKIFISYIWGWMFFRNLYPSQEKSKMIRDY